MQHIDDGAIAAVSDLYDERGLYGEVLDLCSSWVSRVARTPQRLVVLGMNAAYTATSSATLGLVHRHIAPDRL